jgi:excisionase family DNA binding protein
MSAVAKAPQAPRFGSVAQMATYTGLSPKTIRRRVEDGSIRGVKLGRRLLIPFEDVDRRLDGVAGLHPGTREERTVATIHRPAGDPAAAEGPYVPPVAAEALARSNRELVELLDAWESEGDEEEQRETLAVLRESLGARRVASSRNLFP